MSGSHVPSSGQGRRRAPEPPPPDARQAPDPARAPDAPPAPDAPRPPAVPDHQPHAEQREASAQPRTPARRRGSTPARIQAQLSSRTALRDAFRLHEILGPPVSLRDAGDRPGDR